MKTCNSVLISHLYQEKLQQIESDDYEEPTLFCEGCRQYVYENLMADPDWCNDCFERLRAEALSN